MSTGVDKRVEPDGRVSHDPRLVSSYVVTGLDRAGRRWRRFFSGDREGFRWACMMNPWQGTLWAIDHDGRRHRLKRWVN